MDFRFVRVVSGTSDDTAPNTTVPEPADRFGLPAIARLAGDVGPSTKKLLVYLEMLSSAPAELSAATWDVTVWVRDTQSGSGAKSPTSPQENWVQVAAKAVHVAARTLLAVDLGGGLVAGVDVFVQLTGIVGNGDTVAKTVVHASLAG